MINYNKYENDNINYINNTSVDPDLAIVTNVMNLNVPP